MRIALSPLCVAFRLPLAFAPALVLALAAVACGGAAGPETRPARSTDPADAAESGQEPAPVNASAEAALTPPAEPSGEREPRRRREPPPPPEIEPRSEWTIDESIPTPPDLAGVEILAKFRREGEGFVFIYRRDDGEVMHRLQGRLGAYTTVEESFVPDEMLEDDAGGQ